MTEPAYWPNPADWCDDDADKLAEQLGCSRGLALRVMALLGGVAGAGRAATERSDVQSMQVALEMLSQLLALLVQPAKNQEAWIWGLIFAAGLNSSNGARSMAAVARRIKGKKGRPVGRALISHYEREWRLAVPWLSNLKFCRSQAAVENSRAARRRVVAG